MKKSVSLSARVTWIFIAVLFAVIVLLVLVNYLFNNSISMRSNRRVMKAAYTTLSELVRKPDTTVEELQELLEKMRTEENLTFALQGTSEWDFLVATQQFMSQYEKQFLLERLQENFINANAEGVKVFERTPGYTLQSYETPSGSRYLECYGTMKDGRNAEKKFILSMPVEHIYSLSDTLNRYFIWACLLLLAAGAVAVAFLTYRIMKPVKRLTEISKRMSMLDFSARYEGGRADEIGELGNNMNEMASQLERTFLQLKMANEKLQKDIEEKEHVDMMRKDFISNVSHELKTPIALIQGYAEALKELAEDPESRDYYADIIIDESDKMNRMVKKLTTLNQLEFAEEELTVEPFDIMEMIRGLVQASAKMREEHHAVVTVDGPDSLKVLGDEFKIEEVLKNYYSNALNHLEEPYRIRFFTDDLGAKIRISVENTGQNIPEAELDKIWIKFYKVDKARTRAYGGSGIGLSIVKAIMDAHGEECGVYNTDRGVVFWFELKSAAPVPVLQDEEPDRDRVEAMKLGVLDGEIVQDIGKDRAS
ncbi:MAG: HAMP domain-containing protein [Lachnospiraceae bacterium]|nr:HAMP domain-containing protein [Lachnospiraceae bacterium]